MSNRPEIAPAGQVERGAEGDAHPLAPGAGMSTKGPNQETPGQAKSPAFGVTASPRPAQGQPEPGTQQQH